MFRASIQFFVVLDAAVQMQHMSNHLVKVLVIYGTELPWLPSCVRIFSSVQTKWFPTLVKNAYGREWRNLLCHLEQQVADKSWRARPGKVLLSSPINLVISRAQNCLQFISIVLHTFNAIEISAFFRAPFPSAGISSPMGFGISHVALNDWDRATFILWAPDFGPSSNRWQSER